MSIEKIQKTLSEASCDIMRGKVGGLAIVWVDHNGDTKSAYGINDNISSFELLGAVEMLKTRVLHGTIEFSELSEDDDDE
ncbi:hypothetical protein PF327_10845 [Sulfurovum sp. XTW-4]|uniref:Beta-lactamase n=1 Tax=Sulfurovum xiamenensis TaxID=3019066 RepID=A0ABT7QUC8_9BACT|nr:hypothetical protein [Sulfurovum xiamenensis]MDM5264692.1 hypothetical protein [Sulfurovum xiamenensis]